MIATPGETQVSAGAGAIEQADTRADLIVILQPVIGLFVPTQTKFSNGVVADIDPVRNIQSITLAIKTGGNIPLDVFGNTWIGEVKSKVLRFADTLVAGFLVAGFEPKLQEMSFTCLPTPILF